MLFARDLPALVQSISAWGNAGLLEVRHLITDSRVLSSPPHACFFALQGPRHNGHQYLEEMHRKGVRVFVVSYPLAIPLSGAYVVQVDNTLHALQEVAAAHRRQFTYPVVGITGSNGKTTVKEWMAQLAAPLLPVVKSPRSYNSQVGVPLSVWGMQDFHKLALIEAGISEPGEMERLAHVVSPTLGIFTHLGAAHDAGFANRREKFEEKWKLFATATIVVYANDGGTLAQWVQEKKSDKKRLVGWQLTHAPEPAEGGFSVGFDVEGRAFRAILPFSDKASVENALHAATALLVLGLDYEPVLAGLARMRPLAMRLEWKEGQYGSHLLDDTYNNDLDGLQMAVQQLGLYGQSGNARVLMVSDLPEPGPDKENLYKRAAELIWAGGFEQIYAIGPEWVAHHYLLPNQTEYYPDTDAVLASLSPPLLTNKLILLKGGRAFGFERIVHRLQKHSHGTRLEVDLNAVVDNLNFYKARLPHGHKIMAMVKAGAYGAGSYEIASALAYQKVDYLAVAYADEGITLRDRGIQAPIMVMNCVEEQFEACHAYHLEPVLYSPAMLKAWLGLGQAVSLVPIHIELNTGMNRLGFDESDLAELRQLLLASINNLKIASVFTHLSAADDPNQDDFSRQQLLRFKRVTSILSEIWPFPFLRHVANTPAAVRLPDMALDMVRLGIGLYGVEVAGEAGALAQVGRLKTVVSQIRTVPSGESVSYGHKWVFDSARRIATVAIGYADGLSRKMGNGNFAMRVRGGLAPTVGNICMDMTMLDITHLPEVRVLDEVVVFDGQNRLEALAKTEGTIAYEILTRISERVRRVYVSE